MKKTLVFLLLMTSNQIQSILISPKVPGIKEQNESTYYVNVGYFQWDERISFAISKTFDSYIIANERSKGSKSVENLQLSTKEFLEVLKHNFGALVKEPSEKAIKFINQAGTNDANIFNPIKTNFLILVNGNLDKESQRLMAGTEAMQATLNLENTGTDHLFDQIFNMVLMDVFIHLKESPSSLVNIVSTMSDSLKKEFYIFSQENNFDTYSDNFGLSLSIDASGNSKIHDKQVDRKYTGDKLYKCVNKAIGGGLFRFDVSDNTLYKLKTTEKISLDSTNQKEFTAFFTELCGLQSLADAFKKDVSSFLAIELSSLIKLQQILTPAQFSLTKEILSHALNRTVKQFQLAHNNQTFGQIIFTQDNSDSQYLVSPDSKNMKRRILTKAITASEATMEAAQQYTLRAWFAIFFVAMVFFICYAMFNVEIQKDSLLYAKFITEDRR